MTRVFLKILFVFLCVFTVFEAAAQSAFVRKKKTPNFFIPGQELEEKKEVLPTNFRSAIDVEKLKAEETFRSSVQASVAVESDSIDEIDIIMSEDAGENLYVYNNYNKGRVPEYKKVYDEYIADVKYIKRYHKMPVNKGKDEDLNKMKSGERFIVK